MLWGVDPAVFRPQDATAYRAELGFGPDHVVFFSPRSYTQPYYNIDVVIAAAARVHAEEPRARFLFAGYEGDPAPFEAQVQAAGLRDVARVVGRIPHARFAAALNAGDVFISVPSVDATAVSLLEAMSCGRAIIVSSLASACEWITDGQSGRVVEPRAVGQLADAMLFYAADPAARRRHGEAALAGALADAGVEANMAHVDAIVRSLVAGADHWPEAVALPGLRGAARR
ncbi:MAG: glycosyltransferase [Candidatus Krumholzibacteriia bacterium]